MKNIGKLNVFLSLEGDDIHLGTLVLQGKDVYFKISESYLKNNQPFDNDRLHLSPFKIKHNADIQQTGYFPFDGLFGLFADSLPDAWGKLLLDRYLVSKGIANQLNPLTRLAYVGNEGAGALRYEPVVEHEQEADFWIDLSLFQQESEKIIAGEDSLIVDKFYQLSGVSGGARPKINVGFHPKTGEIIPYNNSLPAGFEHWLVKFHSRYDADEVAKVEYAYYLLALKSGIQMAPSRLFKGQNNEAFFATRRFDRIKNQKLHLHSLAGLLHDDFDRSSLDYGHLLDAAFYLTKDRRVYEEILRGLTFNVLYGNQDDHSKNFSFLMNKEKKWSLAPLYDLTYSPSPYDYHALSVSGKYQHIQLRDVKKLGEYFGIRKTEKIIQEVLEVSLEWQKTAGELEIKPLVVHQIENFIEKHRKL